MPDPYDIVRQLTSSTASNNISNRMLMDFASELGWRPSDQLEVPAVKEFANAHLVVEHGLENSAVITFLRRPWRDLDSFKRKSLLAISYNNLVDWHIQVQPDEVIFVFNRTSPAKVVERYPLLDDNIEQLRSEAFEQIVGRRPNPNLPALDDALIERISFWKRRLSAEMNYAVSNGSLSALFNAIIFVRATEDHYLRRVPYQERDSDLTLLHIWAGSGTSTPMLREALRASLETRVGKNIPKYVIDEEKLKAFDGLDRQTVHSLLSDFYGNKYYEYDFSLISKHALSRIYEHYVSILRVEESQQLTFVPRMPEEEREKTYGSVYTPQFVARFFARYLREQMPPLVYKRMRTMDPACGSGIFLRTLLELQLDQGQDGLRTELIEQAFENVFGIDIDENASQAARLSLSLLHLVLTDNLPEAPNIITAEAIKYYQEHPEIKGTYDAVIANPPFVALGTQSQAMRQHIAEFMGDDASGRIDTYLAFLRLGLDMLKPGGYGLFVLPHSFLLSKNARGMRDLISNTSWIRCLADLSAIRVFKDTGAYVILLIFQKKPDFEQEAPPAMILKCQELVGRALQEAIEGQRLETTFYSIYDMEQEAFSESDWIPVPPAELAIKRKFAVLPTIDSFLHIHQGFISGADSVFIIPNNQIPEGEDAIFAPFLHDREMRSYKVPAKTSRSVFYPYIGGNKINEDLLKSGFPQTWAYLNSHREELEKRARGSLNWWEPIRPRSPENIIRPKIVSPHLVLVPRFSLDREGKYAISRSPLLYPKEEAGTEYDFLRFFLAILNSTPCYWYIAMHSHTYRASYVMLEPKTLEKTPVPDPTQVDHLTMRRLLGLVDDRLQASDSNAILIERQIDRIVADLYGLSSDERHALRMDE